MEPPAPTSRSARLGVGAAVVAGAVALTVWLVVVVGRREWFAKGNAYDDVVTVLFVAATPVASAAGLFVARRRARNRSGPLMVALGGVFGAWALASASRGAVASYTAVVVVLLRPTLYWLVIAWPIGRLRRAERPWLVAYTMAVVVLGASWIVLDPFPSGTDGYRFDNPVAPWDLRDISAAMQALLAYALGPAAAAVVLGVVIGRHRQFPGRARSVARPALAAGVVATLTDPVFLVLHRYGADLLRDDDHNTLLGLAVYGLDIGRFVAVPLLLAWSVVRSQRLVTGAVRSIDLEVGAAGVEDAVAKAIGDPTTRLLYRRADGGWYRTDGTPSTVGGEGRTVTTVEVGGEAVACVEHDVRLDGRPAVVEVAVAAAASAITHERMAVLARVRLAEARAARRTIVDVEDGARQRIERDLHDGAQQRLVGLAIQASLAARAGTDDADAMARGVAEARRELDELVAGRLPALLASRGLGQAVSTLAAATPLTVDVRLAIPASLPPDVSSTAWFVVAETVANAVKHAGARRLWIDGRLASGRFELTVRDDGSGGAVVRPGSGLAGLRARAQAAGGVLQVDGRPGQGTTVRFDVAVAS